MGLFTLYWTIKEESSKKLIKDFLKEQDISRTALTDIKFNGGSILINNSPVTVRYQLQIGDVLKVVFPMENPSVDLKPEKIHLDIVYEDDYILVINKPPYLSTIPSREHPSGSLANGLLYYYREIGLESTTHIINRLDRDTSGLMAVAKHRHVHHIFSQQQKAGKIKRRYEAVVHGEMERNEGIINAPIGRKDTSIIEREVRSDGQRAVTHFKVLKRLNGYSHLSLELETGRTHQIRVHLSYLGHPLVGDDLYGGLRTEIGRQALHGSSLSFFHPFYLKDVAFHASLPKDITQLLKM